MLIKAALKFQGIVRPLILLEKVAVFLYAAVLPDYE